MGLLDRAIASSLSLIPKGVVRRVARQYVAGETLADGLDEVRRLNAAGCCATLDLLGEAVRAPDASRAAAAAYVEAIDAIVAQGLDANVSLKPTQLGLGFGRDAFLDIVRPVIRHARERELFVRIDMEDASTTDDTLAAVRQLHAEGLTNTGPVLQAMLRRSLADLRALEELSPRIRVCKGIYQEPADVAFQDRDEVVRSFAEMLAHALPRPAYHIGVATHDDRVIAEAERLVAEHGLTPDRYELQMLLGVRPEVREALVARGHRVRVYVPFGVDWYAYCVRRLKENPKFAGYVTRDVLRDPRMLLGEGER